MRRVKDPKNSFLNFENSLPPTQPIREDQKVIRCPSCNCSFFERILVAQFVPGQIIAPGMRPSPLEDREWCLLRCARCMDLLEPEISMSPRDYHNSKYAQLVEEMEDESWKQPNLTPLKGEAI